MRIKLNVLAWMAVSILAFSSCKKEKKTSASIIGKWNVVNQRVVIKTNGTVTNDNTTTARSGEWVEFLSNGKVNNQYYSESENRLVYESEFARYTVDGSKLYVYIFTNDPGVPSGETEEIYDIKTLTSNALTLYQESVNEFEGQVNMFQAWVNFSR